MRVPSGTPGGKEITVAGRFELERVTGQACAIGFEQTPVWRWAAFLYLGLTGGHDDQFLPIR